ncbi:MAG TPA: branched-chain amino acid ABC transporter permease [Acidimicrobiia bacterium]|nr:branched-chain amino acid ABC transporter permease [Acidimicrobiia bacterium]
MTARTRVLIGFAVAAVALFFVPAITESLELPRFYVIFLITIFFWISQASSWNVLTGFSGYFSFGQGAWYGIGVYTVAVLTGKHGWSFITAVPVAGLLALIGGLGLGFVVFRVRRLTGEIFALTTLAIAFVLASVARITSAIDGGTGIFMTGTPIPEFLGEFNTAMYRMTLLVMLLTVLAAYLTHDSRLGWGLFSIRDDEPVAGGLGVPVFRYKMVALGINAFFAGLMGGVWALQLGFVTIEDVFNIRVPLFVILMSVLGGLTHWMGPVVGAVIIYTFSDRLNSAGLTDVNQIIVGALLVILALAVREGIYPRMRDRWVTTLVTFGGAMAILVIFDLTESLITDSAFAMLATVLVLMVPDRLWARIRGSDGGDDARPMREPVGPLAEVDT